MGKEWLCNYLNSSHSQPNFTLNQDKCFEADIFSKDFLYLCEDGEFLMTFLVLGHKYTEKMLSLQIHHINSLILS